MRISRWLARRPVKVGFVALVIGLGFTELYGNSGCLLLWNAYFIPAESNLLVVHADADTLGTVLRESWGTGSDGTNFYQLIEDRHYMYIARDNDCPGSDRLDLETWCEAVEVRLPE